jgi:AraC-like DNA-binding protein
MAAAERIQATDTGGGGNTYAYRAAPPCPALAGVARLLWDVDGTSGPVNERILPTGDVVIIVDRHPRAVEGAFVCGLQLGPILSSAPEESFFTGARLTPLGAFKVLGVPVGEITGALVDLSALLPREAESLRDELISKPGPARRIAAMQRFLLRRLPRGPMWHDAAVGAWGLLNRFHGAVRVETAADAAGISSRQLGRIFREQIGLSPKNAARLLRFERATALISAGDSSLAEVAAGAGFADQAHLSREFQAFAGASPSAYRERKLVGGDQAFMRD